MVRAKILHSRDNLLEEYKLFFASMAANSMAEEAVTVAHEKSWLAKLDRRMDEIQKREGLEEDEF